MNNKIYLSICIVFSIALHAHVHGQDIFLKKGWIEFERQENVVKDMEGMWAENFKDKIPKFKITYHNLYFDESKTLFINGKEPKEKHPWFNEDASDDIIFSDLNAKKITKKQQVFERTILLQDSLRNVEWRITDETRDIIGFECRKAVGKLLDSIYVVAFFTDQIPVNGGPLSFSQLPGMILGLAIPRYSITYFATKIEATLPTKPQIVAPSHKSKPMGYSDLFQMTEKAMKDWGKWGKKYQILFML